MTKRCVMFVLWALLGVAVHYCSHAHAATLVWNAPACDAALGNCATGYHVSWRQTPAGAWQERDVAGVTSYGLDLLPLQNATGYEFRVDAYNAAGRSGWSNSALGNGPSPPAAPADFLATAAEVSWSAPSCTPAGNDCPTGYRVFWQQLPSGAEQHADLPAAARLYSTISMGLMPCYQYRVSVAALNGAQVGPRAQSIDMCLPCPPNTPETVRIE